MSGNKDGGKKAAATNRALYGPDFYARIGSKGGKKSRGGGFTGDPERARILGAIGGKKSRKRKRHEPDNGQA